MHGFAVASVGMYVGKASSTRGVEPISSFSGTMCRVVRITQTVWAGDCQRTVNVVQKWCKFLDCFCNKLATQRRGHSLHEDFPVIRGARSGPAPTQAPRQPGNCDRRGFGASGE